MSLEVQFMGSEPETAVHYEQGEMFLSENGTTSVRSSHSPAIAARLAAFAPSGKVRLIAREGQPLTVEPFMGAARTGITLAESGKVDTVVLSDHIAAGVLPDGAIVLWDLKTGKLSKRLSGPAPGRARLAMSADGKRLVTVGSDSVLRVWDTTSGKEVRVCNEKGPVIEQLALSADGKKALTSHGTANAVLWDLETGEQVARLPALRKPALSAGGKRAADTDGKQVRIWELEE
jgi:WD40 repeat protein